MFGTYIIAIMSSIIEQHSQTNMGPYESHGIDELHARDSVQQLESAMRAAENKKTNIERHYAVEIAIRDFRESAYGKLAWHFLNRDGHLLVPLLSSSDVEEKTTQMRLAVVDKLLTKTDDGNHMVSDTVTKKQARITGESRFMIDPGKLGEEFVGCTGEMVDTLGCVLLAIAYGAYERVESEHISLLLNNDNVQKQALHRDHCEEEIDKQLHGSGRGPRSRPQPPPFSALCAFQQQTSIHAVDGSHLNPLQTKFSANEAKQCHIPVGWACLFHAALVHAGMGSVGPYHARVHMFFKTKGTPAVYGGKIQLVADEAVGLRARATNGNALPILRPSID